MIATPPLSGATCLVTGATSGIGLATARALASLGAALVLVGRDPGRAEAARAMVAEAGAESGAPPPVVELADFSSMREVEALAGRLGKRLTRLDVIVNCAGVYTAKRVMTAEGLETQFAVNHLAPFLLTTSLLPLLGKSSSARVVTVSSESHYFGWIRWRDPSLRGHYLGLWAYEQSKLANVLFSAELARRLGPDSRIWTYAADPGLVDTAMGQKHGFSLSSLFWRLRRRGGTSPEVPAEAIAFLASSGDVAGMSGLYWRDGRVKPASRLARRRGDGERLWRLSEAAVESVLARPRDAGAAREGA